MASSGWLGEKTILTVSAYSVIKGNLRIDSITHSGTNLTVTGAIRNIVRAGTAGGTSGYCTWNSPGYGTPKGTSQKTVVPSGTTLYVGQYKDVSFSTTITGVSASATSYNFTVSWSSASWYNTTQTWTLSFDPSGSAPSGLAIEYIDSTYNSVTMRASIADWGADYKYIEAIYNSHPSDFSGARTTYKASTTSEKSGTVVATNDNFSWQSDPSFTMAGMRQYYIANYTQNSAGLGASAYDPTPRYLPPAPGDITYTHAEGTDTWTLTYTPRSNLNWSGYDKSQYAMVIKYKINGGAEVTVPGSANAETPKTFTITIPGGETANIVAYQTYHGMESEKTEINLTNGNVPVHLYGSVSNQAQEIKKLYGSVNGQAKEIVKLYASVGGSTRLIYKA